MKYALLFVFFSYLLSLLFPWWIVIIPGLMIGYFSNLSKVSSFVIGFISIFMLWLIQIVFIHIGNEGILSQRMADLLSVPSPWFVIMASAFIGGLVGGLSMLSGNLWNPIPLRR